MSSCCEGNYLDDILMRNNFYYKATMTKNYSCKVLHKTFKERFHEHLLQRELPR